MNTVNLTCDYCHKDFKRSIYQHRSNIKKGVNKFYCSNICNNKSRTKKDVIKKCLGCYNNFVVKYNSQYCSNICANKNRPKNLKIVNCKKCGIYLGKGYTCKKVCKDCNSKNKNWDNVTLQDLKDQYDINQYHAKIRSIARSVYKKYHTVTKCCNCGYSKHYEICHIKDIKDFNLNTSIAEVNSKENLIALCRNCHWEFDHKMLTLEQIIGRA